MSDVDPVAGEHQQQRQEFLRSYGLVGGAIASILALGYLFGLKLFTGGLVLAACAGGLFALPVLARRLPVPFVGHVAAALVLAPVAYVTSLRGDLPLGALVFLCVPPVATGFLAGSRAAIGWALASSALIGVAFWRVSSGRAAYVPELLVPEVYAQHDLFEAVGMVGVVVLMTGMALSIERRRRLVAREQQRLHDELERRRGAARVGRLAAGVAHEINNPVAWMTSGTSWLGQHVPTPEGSEAREVLGELTEGLRRVTRIVSHLQAVARPGRADDGASPKRVLEIVETLGQCNDRGERRKQPLQVSAPEGLRSVVASEGGLAQLLLELVLDSKGDPVKVSAVASETGVAFVVTPVAAEGLLLAGSVVHEWGGSARLEGEALRLELPAR